MRIGFAIFLVVAFVSMFVVAYGEVQDEATPAETTVEKTVWMPSPESTEQTILQPTGGPSIGGGPAVILSAAAALLLGSGSLAYAVLRRR